MKVWDPEEFAYKNAQSNALCRKPSLILSEVLITALVENSLADIGLQTTSSV